MSAVLVTGGAGYIGSHVCVELLSSGYDVIVLDNFSNSSLESCKRVKDLIGRDILIYEGDILDSQLLDKIFSENRISSVIHLAGLKSVAESVAAPILYYDNNFLGTLCLLKAMQRSGVKDFVFSSSATVYGAPELMPISESTSTGGATNPYGRSKYMVEELLKDISSSDPSWNIALLRYFNPIGAHPSGVIGESPKGIPNNLLPYISRVASGEIEHLTVYGNDYPTCDGTGVRDYIHVVDLARAHLSALAYASKNTGCEVFNIGTGKGSSVLDIVHAFEKASGQKVPYVIGPRRAGDLATVYADPAKAKAALGFETKYDLQRMCEDSWRWQKNNPNGFNTNNM